MSRPLSFAILALAILFFAQGCKPKQMVTEKVILRNVMSHDTLLRTDTLLKRDSVTVFVTQEGQTQYVDRWHTEYKVRNIDRVRLDTILRIDSIPVYVEKPKNDNADNGRLRLIVWMLGTIICAYIIKRKQ